MSESDTMTPVPELTSAQAHLIARLKAIPEGGVHATARAAGINVRQLNRLREGKSPDVRLSTLERLATALGESIGQIVGSEPPPPRSAPAGPDIKAVRRLVKHLRALGDDAARVAASLPPE